MPILGVVIASTREGRVGALVADWFAEVARGHGGFEVEMVDLKATPLPLLEEPQHPRLGRYEHETTKAWSARVKAIDAFVFVTPEYNHGAPPALVNALDHLHHEWSYKASAFVSYGGVSGGTRSVLMTKVILTCLKVVPIVEAVTIPFVSHHVEAGAFKGEPFEKAAITMLDELVRWNGALHGLRHTGS